MKALGNKELYQNKEWLILKYLNEKLSTYDIAKICGNYHATILFWLKRHGIERRKDSGVRPGQRHPNWGKSLSKKTKEKISKSMKGRELSIEHRLKKSEAVKGIKHPNWKGGISSKYNKFRSSIFFRIWREAVLQRDEHKCLGCGELNKKKLDIHHILSFKEFPELRTEILNGMTLCKICHRRIHFEN